MKKRIISVITAFFMTVTMMAGTVMPVMADTYDGGLMWSYRDASNSAMTGITSPSTDEEGKYIYVASAKQFYKLDAKSGELKGKVTLSGSVGYNKIAPVIAEDKAFIPLGAGKLDIVDTAAMKLIRTVQFADAESHKGHQTLTPAVYDRESNSVYLGTWRKGHGGVYAKVSLDDYSSTVIAESDTGFYWSGASVSGDYVVFGSASDGSDDPNTPSDGDAVLYAYCKADGSVLETILEGSGSICTSVVAENGKYYFVSKKGRLYEACISDGELRASIKAELGSKSTCTPYISGGKVYIGTASSVMAVDLETGKTVASYKAPADVKGLIVVDDKVYCTYNKSPGGLYDVTGSQNYYVPHSSMQQYCISTIIAGNDGTLYYSNDSNNVFAVRDTDDLISAGWGSISYKTVSYTGTARKPVVTVTYKGETLTAGKDYIASYSCNIYPGTANVTVKGTGGYAGVHYLTFAISKPKVAAQKTLTQQLYGADDFKVTWSTQKVTGAAVKYKVQYQKYGGSWSTIYNGTTASSCKKANLADGVKYRFRVTPYVKVNGVTYSGTSKTTGYMYTLKTPAKPAVKRVSTKKATLKWGKVNGASGYKIYRATSKNGKYKCIKTVSGTSVKITAKKGSKYYYKVRAYKKSGKNIILGPGSSYRYYKFK